MESKSSCFFWIRLSQPFCIYLHFYTSTTIFIIVYVYLPWYICTICTLTRTYALGSNVYLPGLTSSDHMYTYQDLCPWIICILYLPGPMSLDHMYTVLTRTYVLGSYVYLPGLMSLDHMYTVLTRTYVLGSYVYCTYQDLCPWIIRILTRTYVLGSYVYLPGLMSLDHMYTYQDLCPWKTTDKQAQDRLIHRQKMMGRIMYRQVEIEVYRCWIQK